MHLLSPYCLIIPVLPAQACGFLAGNPSPEVATRMGQTNHHSQAPAGLGKEEDDTRHLEVLV